MKILLHFIKELTIGEMQEWLNWHAWKACVLQNGTEGSNPSLSAVNYGENVLLNIVRFNFIIESNLFALQNRNFLNKNQYKQIRELLIKNLKQL